MTKKAERPGALSREEMLTLADHVRTVLINNAKVFEVNLHIDPILDRIERGQRTGPNFKQLQQSCFLLQEKYPSLFFNDKKDPENDK